MPSIASDAAAPTHDRPRERLLAEGARSLSDAELVALLLGTGTARLSARAAALALLEAVPLPELAWAPPDAIAALPGRRRPRARPRSPPPSSSAAAARGRRRAAASAASTRAACSSSCATRPTPSARGSTWCCSTSAAGSSAPSQVAEGSLSQCPVSPRDALRPAVREGAHSIVFCHNHPSGDPSPSADDADLTERLRAAAELVGVLARDHVIVAAGGYYSFVEAGRWRR